MGPIPPALESASTQPKSNPKQGLKLKPRSKVAEHKAKFSIPPVEIEPFPEACETSETVKQMSAKEKVAVNAEIWESEEQIGPKQANDEAASGVNGGMCLINSSPDVHGAIALEQDVLRNNTISSSALMKKDHAEKRGILLNPRA